MGLSLRIFLKELGGGTQSSFSCGHFSSDLRGVPKYISYSRGEMILFSGVMSVKDVMTKEVVTIDMPKTILDAAMLLNEKRRGSVVVICRIFSLLVSGEMTNFVISEIFLGEKVGSRGF